MQSVPPKKSYGSLPVADTSVTATGTKPGFVTVTSRGSESNVPTRTLPNASPGGETETREGVGNVDVVLVDVVGAIVVLVVLVLVVVVVGGEGGCSVLP